MESVIQTQTSPFAQLVDKLRNKSDEELKKLYTRLLADELKEEWKRITAISDFGSSSEEDIITAIQQSRYKGNDV